MNNAHVLDLKSNNENKLYLGIVSSCFPIMFESIISTVGPSSMKDVAAYH